YWSIGQVFGRYRNYQGEKDRPLTEQEMNHLNMLMDEATVVVDKFAESDPEQARWHARICESFEGTRVSVVATPWDQALANRVPLDLSAVTEVTLDAKLAMADVVLHGVDRANRRRLGLPEDTDDTGNGQRNLDEPPRWHSQPLPPSARPDTQLAPDGPAQPAAARPATQLRPACRAHPAAAHPSAPAGAASDPDTPGHHPCVRFIPNRPTSEQPTD